MSQEKRWWLASISLTPSLRLAVSASCPARTSQSADRWNANWARILANGSRLSWPRDPVSTNHSSPQLALDEHPAGGGDEGVAGAQIPRVQGGAGGAEAFPPIGMIKHLHTYLSIVIDMIDISTMSHHKCRHPSFRPRQMRDRSLTSIWAPT